jgi:uncharacterized membrane protein YgdD (TMEM256/DUF423 family)
MLPREGDKTMTEDSKIATQAGSPRIAAFGSLLAFAGVFLGAMGTHALKSQISPLRFEVFETAVRYQLWHAIALVAIGLSPAARERVMSLPATLMIVGVVLFSGSLYALAIDAPTWLGFITPLGGLCLMAGWLSLALVVRARS